MSGFPRRRAVAVALIVFALVGLAASGSSLARSHVAASTAKHPRVLTGQSWQNPDQPPLVRAHELLAMMSTDQKIDLALGNFAPLQSLGIPALSSDDGPDGLRSSGTTAMPSGQDLAASFNRALARAYGDVVGSEARGQRPRARIRSWPATPRPR